MKNNMNIQESGAARETFNKLLDAERCICDCFNTLLNFCEYWRKCAKNNEKKLE